MGRDHIIVALTILCCSLGLIMGYELQHLSEKVDKLIRSNKHETERIRRHDYDAHELIDSLSGHAVAILTELQHLSGLVCGLPTSCLDALNKGQTESGIIKIKPDSDAEAMEVYCDQVTDGGGWVVFQRRKDGSVDFERDWVDYKQGFGSLDGEFWFGNDKIHQLLNKNVSTQVRVDLEDFSRDKAFATYTNFNVGPESDNYRLTFGDYSGNAGDSLELSRNAQFSTRDRDNDIWTGACLKYTRGGWWHNKCTRANLNGVYSETVVESSYNVNWWTWEKSFPLKFTEIKFRPSA